MPNLIIIDPHPLYREALSQFIDQLSAYQRLGSYAAPSLALQETQEVPEAIVLRRSPVGQQPDTRYWVDQLRARWPQVAILILGVPTLTEEGALAPSRSLLWLSRQCAPQQLLNALDQLTTTFPLTGSALPSSASLPNQLNLTATELQLWEGYLKGIPTLQIAATLGLRQATWRATHQNLLTKLNVHTLWGLHYAAQRYGLFQASEPHDEGPLS